jgi:cytochrome c oxidase subunit 4
MADAHHPGDHAGPNFQFYLVIGIALTVFTAVSFVVNVMVRRDHITPTAGFLIILAVAVIKATLVGMYFMHLRWDWPKLYFMIIPAFILAAMSACATMPDIVLAWHQEPLEPPVSITGTR